MLSVKLNDLSIGYRTGKETRQVATGLCASLFSGELTCLLGPNGVGKSTLLRTLAAFQPPLGGTITIGGTELNRMSAKQMSRIVGIVLTEKPDVPGMTAREMVAMGRSPYTGFWGRQDNEDETIVSQSLETVGISQLAHRLLGTLSDGERQKVMIAKALAQQTPIVLLDEPTAFLDFPSKVDTMLLLRRICREQQKTVFLSTHDLELALQTADRLWLMMPGGNLHVGTPRELAHQGYLAQFIQRPNVAFNPDTLTITVH
jgi:iron complex transport system ATP-binding protein